MSNSTSSMFSSDEELSCPPLFDTLEGLEDDENINSGSPLLDAALLNTPPLPEICNNPTPINNPTPFCSSSVPAPINLPLLQSYSNEGVLSRPEDLIPLWPLESCIDSSSSTPTQQHPLACSSFLSPSVMETEPLLTTSHQGSVSPAFNCVEFHNTADEDAFFSSSYSPSSSQELAADLPMGNYFPSAAGDLCSTSPQHEFTSWTFPLVFDPSSSPSSGMASPLSSSISSPLPDIGFMSLCSPCSTRPPSSMDSEVDYNAYSEVEINSQSELGTDNESAFVPISDFLSSFDNTSYSSQLLDAGQELVFSTPSFNQLTTGPIQYVDANNFIQNNYPANNFATNTFNTNIEYYCENGHDGNHVEVQLGNNGNNFLSSTTNRDTPGTKQPHSHQSFVPYSSTARPIQYLPEYIAVPPHIRAEYNNVLAELTALAPAFLASNDPRNRAEYNHYHASLSKIRPPSSDTNLTPQDEEDQQSRVQMHNGIKKVLGLPQQLNSPTKAANIRRIPSRAPMRMESSPRSRTGLQSSDYAQQYRDTLARLMQKKAAKRSSEVVVENCNPLDTFIRDSKIIRLTHAYHQFSLDPSPTSLPNAKKRKTKKDVIENIHKQIPEFSTVPTPQVKTSKKPVREFWKQF